MPWKAFYAKKPLEREENLRAENERVECETK
jgi:hypothetical protein